MILIFPKIMSHRSTPHIEISERSVHGFKVIMNTNKQTDKQMHQKHNRGGYEGNNSDFSITKLKVLILIQLDSEFPYKY